MQAESFVASFLLVCLVCFFLINFHNILRTHKCNRATKSYSEVECPSSLLVGTAAFGTFVYFIEALVYPFLVFMDLLYVVEFVSFQFFFMLYVQILGLVLTGMGYFLFAWSVIARGKYARSWSMPDDHKLVTWGPYKHLRHPSYLGYFLMFFGLFALWPNFFTLIPLVAIPGYLCVTFQEERLLVQRFGEEYVEYQEKTGRFVPRS